MVVKLIESWISRQSANTLDTSHLVKNPPYCKIHVKLVEGPYLRRQIHAIVKDFARNLHPCMAQKTAKLSCCGQYFIFGPPSQVFASANAVCVSLLFLKYVAKFCDEKFVWSCIDFFLFVEDFGKTRRRFCKIHCWNW